MEFRMRTKIDEIEFSGGSDLHGFLKPEEVGVGLVSSPLSFKEFLGGIFKRSQAWLEFENKLKSALGNNLNRGMSSMDKQLGEDQSQSQYRMVLTTSTDLDVQKQDTALPGNDKHFSQIKLISNISTEQPHELRELGCLALLASVCGHENVEVVIQGRLQSRYINVPLFWNREDLCWNSTEKLSLLETLGSCLTMRYVEIFVNLTDDGICGVLQRVYGRPGVDWRLQQKLLEEEKFADVEVVSKLCKKRKFKCHRSQLAGASAVFAEKLEEAENSDRTSGAKRRKCQAPPVELSESEDAIEALLHFVYYGGCERIFDARVDVILELLEAGEKYQIPNLVDVCAFVLHVETRNTSWLTVDAAMKLFYLARPLKGVSWTEVKNASWEIIRVYGKDRLMTSAAFQELYNEAVKLGQVFEFLLVETLKHPSIRVGVCTTQPQCFPSIGPDVAVTKAVMLYDFLDFGGMLKKPVNLCAGLATMMLAEFCGKALPSFANALVQDFLKPEALDSYGIDYWTELFRYSRTKTEACWEKLKMGAVKMLQKALLEHRDKVKESQKYREMLHQDPEAFEDFTWLSHLDLDGAIKKLKGPGAGEQ